jgi:hypothetical protein
MLWLWRTLKNQKPPHSVVLLGLARCPNVQFAPMASLVSRASETVCSHLSVESRYPKLPCCCSLLWPPRFACPTEQNVFTPHTYTFRSSFCTLSNVLCCCMQSGETFSLWSSVSRSLWPALIFLMSNPQSTMFCYRWKCITRVLFFVVCTYGIQEGALTAQYFTGSSQNWNLIDNRCASQTWAWNQ